MLTTVDDHEVIEKKLHDPAKDLIKAYTKKFKSSLLLQARILAHRDNHELVLVPHVKDALKIVEKRHKLVWPRELAVIIGGALIGAFVTGLITETFSGTTLLIIASGFVGLTMVYWGFWR